MADEGAGTAPNEAQEIEQGTAAAAAGDAPARPAGEGSGGKQDGTGLLLPLARIKKMMKEGDDVKIVSADASWAVARATELFLQELALKAHASMADSSRKTLEYKDVAAVVKNWSALDFLSEVLPPKVRVGDVREQLQKQLDEYLPRVINDD